MNSFTLTAVGHLARNPEPLLPGQHGLHALCLVGTDYAARTRRALRAKWSRACGLWPSAPLARRGRATFAQRRLVVEARVRANNWTDKQGEKQYDHAFVVQDSAFGAPGRMKREEHDARREDGHGLHRCDDRPNGRDRSANGGPHASTGAQAGSGTHAGLSRRTAGTPASEVRLA